MDIFPRHDKGNAIAGIHIRLFFDIVAVAMVADNNKQAVGIFCLDLSHKFDQFPLGIPVMTEFPQEFFVLLISRRQCYPHFFLVIALGLYIHIIG